MPHDEIHRGCAVSVGLVVPPVAAPCSHAPYSYSFALRAIRPRRRTGSRECVLFGAAVKRRWLRYEISPRLCAPACADRIERRSTAREPQAHARLRSRGAHFAQESRLLKYHITENVYFEINVRGMNRSGTAQRPSAPAPAPASTVPFHRSLSSRQLAAVPAFIFTEVRGAVLHHRGRGWYICIGWTSELHAADAIATAHGDLKRVREMAKVTKRQSSRRGKRECRCVREAMALPAHRSGCRVELRARHAARSAVRACWSASWSSSILDCRKCCW